MATKSLLKHRATTEPEFVPCPKCDGVGDTGWPPRECEACDGTGVVVKR